MQADLDALKDESLDHIARRMDDIRRRLDLGRAGPEGARSRRRRDRLARQADRGNGATATSRCGRRRGRAAGAARAPATRCPTACPSSKRGRAKWRRKPIGNESGWGNLPPKERQEALQQIGKDFPAHYRDMIEQYFRKLASEGSEDNG